MLSNGQSNDASAASIQPVVNNAETQQAVYKTLLRSRAVDSVLTRSNNFTVDEDLLADLVAPLDSNPLDEMLLDEMLLDEMLLDELALIR